MCWLTVLITRKTPLKVTDPLKSKWNRLFILAKFRQFYWATDKPDDKFCAVTTRLAENVQQFAERAVYLFYTRVLPDVVVFGEIEILRNHEDMPKPNGFKVHTL